MAAVVAVSCCSIRMPGFFACQPRRWECFQTGVSDVRAAWYTIRAAEKNPGFLRVGSERARRGKSGPLPASRGGGRVFRQAYRVSGRLVHDPAVAARRIPAFCVWVQSGQPRKKPGFGGGQSPAFGIGGPGGTKRTSGSGSCGVVLQDPNAGLFRALTAAAVGGFSGRRIGCPGGLVHDPAVAAQKSRLSACGFRAGKLRKKPGFAGAQSPAFWNRRPGW